MDVVIIGTGHVANVIGRELIRKGHRILAIWGRDQERVNIMAAEWNSRAVAAIADLPHTADAFLLAVSDKALGTVCEELGPRNGLVLHHAGAVPISVLAASSPDYGVLWPIKMLKKDMDGLDNCTLAIEASNAHAMQLLRELAQSLSVHVVAANDETRLKMHLIAAVTSNFTNHLYHLAADFCNREGLDVSWFYPLIETTATQIKDQHPRQVQAGPAFRDDVDTMDKHRSVLEEHPQLLHLYDEISASIRKSFGR